jgi:hypothetical protein
MPLVIQPFAVKHAPELVMLVLEPARMRFPGLEFLLEKLLVTKQLTEHPVFSIEARDVAVALVHITLVKPNVRSLDLGLGIVNRNVTCFRLNTC